MKLADFSPLVGMLTGEGAMGRLIGKGFGGAIPASIARSAQKAAAEEEEREKAIAAEAQRQSMQGQPAQEQGMKKGGMARSSASRRADGIALRGKTRGKLR
jgi:hypothetical protein